MPHTVTEIKHYVSTTNKDGTLNWNSTGKTDDEVEEMLTAYVNGMKKWNNAYFYYQNSNVIKMSDNGNYILSNGLVILQDVDVEAYLNNTLVFRDISEEIMWYTKIEQSMKNLKK